MLAQVKNRLNYLFVSHCLLNALYPRQKYKKVLDRLLLFIYLASIVFQEQR